MTYKGMGMTKIRMRAVAALCFVSMTLGACGGGGDSSSAPPAVPTDVRVALVNAVPINVNVERTGTPDPVLLKGIATGNLSSLNGKTVYVVIEDPNGLFNRAPEVGGPSSQGEIDILLTVKTQNTLGTFSGNLTVHACLDSACKSELVGSPAQVPYTLRVLPEVQISTNAINVNATFGEPAFTRTFTLQTAGVASLGWVLPAPFGAPTPFALASPDSGLSTTYTITFFPMAPGQYRHTLTLNGIAEADGVSYAFVKKIAIRYDTADNPAVDYVFSVPSIEVNTTPQISQEANFWPLVRPGVTMTWRGMEYLTYPAAAEGNPWLNRWWDDTTKWVSVCGELVPGSRQGYCLPTGTYTARGHYTMTKAGVDTEVYFPVTMHATAPN
jgi:hypothetical protein